MWFQFFAQNAHFAISLLAGLICLAVSWLYFDAWSDRKLAKGFFRWFGFFGLALSFLAQATIVEQSVLDKLFFGNYTAGIVLGLRLFGYASIIIGELIDPIQKIPTNIGLGLDESPKPLEATADKPENSTSETQEDSKTTKTDVKQEPEVDTTEDASEATALPTAKVTKKTKVKKMAKNKSKLSAIFTPSLSLSLKFASPIAGLLVAVLYWRRATTGLERKLKPVAIAFMFIGLSDLTGLANLLQTTDNPNLYAWVAAFGWIWSLSQILLLIGAVVLGRWIWGYLTKRLFSEIYMVFVLSAVIVLLTVSVSFTFLLLRNIRTTTLDNLDTAARVLDYALSSKQSETLAGAQQLASSQAIISGVEGQSHDLLVAGTKTYLQDKHQSDFIITDRNGLVYLRGIDSSSWGDSVSDDPLIRRALLGKASSSIAFKQVVGSPTVYAQSSAIIRNASGQIVGTVTTSLELGPAFVDSIKQATGLQSSIYAGDTLAATTNLAPDGKSRNIGTKLGNQTILNTVLKQGKDYTGELNTQNRQLVGALLPLKDVDNAPVGMLSITEPQSLVLKTAGKSIGLTFLIAVVLLLVSTLPLYFTTRSLTDQLD